VASGGFTKVDCDRRAYAVAAKIARDQIDTAVSIDCANVDGACGDRIGPTADDDGVVFSGGLV